MYERLVLHFPGFIAEEGENAKFGQHCFEFGYYVKNGKGAVGLNIMTGWYPFEGAIGTSRGYSTRMVWHLPLPRNPLEYADKHVHDCGIIGQKCIGSSSYDHEGKWMKLLCYSTQEHFWTKLERFHDHICNDGPWDSAAELIPDRLYLLQRGVKHDTPF